MAVLNIRALKGSPCGNPSALIGVVPHPSDLGEKPSMGTPDNAQW